MKSVYRHSSNPLQAWVEAPLVLLVGGVGYYLIELLWRGHSHPAMLLCGAICFYFVYRLSCTYPDVPVLYRALLGAVFITGIELISGCVLNLGLGLAVWDYSDLPFHFLGQICLFYSIGWFLLCFPLCRLARWIHEYVFLASD